MLRLLPLFLVLFLAVAVRWTALHEGLWLDELHSTWAAEGDWSEVSSRARYGNQSPLYFYLLKALLSAGPTDEWWARLPSLIPCLLTVSLIYCLVLQATASVKAAVAVSLAATVDPKFIFYGTEARPYALVQLIAIATVVGFARCAARSSRPLRLAWIGGSIVLCYLHYTAVVIPAATLPILFWLKVRYGREVTYAWSEYSRDILTVIVVTAPLSTHMFEIAGRRQQWTQFVTPPEGWRWLAHLDLDYWVLAPLLLFATARLCRKFCAMKFGSGQGGQSRKVAAAPSSDSARNYVGEAAWGFTFLPVLVVYAIAATGSAPVMLYRYLIVVPPMAMLGWTVLIRHLGGLGKVFFAISLLAYCVYGMGYYSRWQREKPLLESRGESWGDVAEMVRQDRIPILLRSGYIEANGVDGIDIEDQSAADRELVEYCLGPIHASYDFGSHRIEWPLPNELPDYDVEPVARLLSEQREAWIILRIPNRRKRESYDWVERLFEARGGGSYLSKNWFGRILLLRVRFRNQSGTSSRRPASTDRSVKRIT